MLKSCNMRMLFKTSSKWIRNSLKMVLFASKMIVKITSGCFLFAAMVLKKLLTMSDRFEDSCWNYLKRNQRVNLHFLGGGF